MQPFADKSFNSQLDRCVHPKKNFEATHLCQLLIDDQQAPLLSRSTNKRLYYYCLSTLESVIVNIMMISSRNVQLALASCLLAASNLPSISSFSATKTGPSNLAVRSNVFAKPMASPFSLGSGRGTCNNDNYFKHSRHVVYMTADDANSDNSDTSTATSNTSTATSKSSSDSDNNNSSGATVTQLIANLIKGIVGAGVLSLPAGIAAWGSAPAAVVPAVALIATIGALSGYGFALIGRCCAYTNTESYRDAWSATVSESSSWIPATAVTFKTICAILAYSMILGDTFVSLLSTAGFAATKVPVTLGLTGAVLLPLCLMKNLSSLAPFSLLGSFGMIYTSVAMMIRYFGKAYAASGKFGMDMAASLRPKFGDVGASGIVSPSAAILVGMLSTAYMVRRQKS